MNISTLIKGTNMEPLIKGKKYTLKELPYDRAILIIQLCMNKNVSNIIKEFEALGIEKTSSNLVDYVENKTSESLENVWMII